MSTQTPADLPPEYFVVLQTLVGSQCECIVKMEQWLAWFLAQYRLAPHRRFAAWTGTGVQQPDLFAVLWADVLPDDPATAPALLPVTASTEDGLPVVAW